jgi:growth factor-regulated tyrosine kinase substrate
MHEKLSQAVKLYDQILSQQVSQPRWRTSHTSPVNLGQYHQPHQHYTTANGYYQWNPQTSPSQVLYQPNSAHAAKPISNQITQVSPTLQENQLQYVPNPQPQPQQSFRHTHAEYQSMVAPIASAALPPAIQSPTYSQPTYAAMQPVQSTPTILSPMNTPQSPPPLSHYQAPSTHLSPQQQSAPVDATLVRHNTVAYPSSPPALSSFHLGRSNTISSSFSQPHRPPQQAFQNLPAAAAMVSPLPPAPATLPQFPSVPTSVPQPTYSIYTSSMPSGFEQKEERKEVLLIDL